MSISEYRALYLSTMLLGALSLLILTSCSDDDYLIEEEMPQPMPEGYEPIGIDTLSLLSYTPILIGDIKKGKCRIIEKYFISASIDPITGEETITNSDTTYNVYDEWGKIIIATDFNFRDSLIYQGDQLIEVIRNSDNDNFGIGVSRAHYSYNDDRLVETIDYENWFSTTPRLDTFYYNDAQQLIRINEYILNEDFGERFLATENIYSYYDNGRLRSYKEVSYECTDICPNHPSTQLYVFYHHTDIKLPVTVPLYHITPLILDYVYLGQWRYAYNSTFSYDNDGWEVSPEDIEYNEYGYLINRYSLIECLPD